MSVGKKSRRMPPDFQRRISEGVRLYWARKKGQQMIEAQLKELNEIADVAKAQREGAYTPQSDAMTALALVERLAHLLIVDVSAKCS